MVWGSAATNIDRLYFHTAGPGQEQFLQEYGRDVIAPLIEKASYPQQDLDYNSQINSKVSPSRRITGDTSGSHNDAYST